jgi:hypothetical protein
MFAQLIHRAAPTTNHNAEVPMLIRRMHAVRYWDKRIGTFGFIIDLQQVPAEKKEKK